MLPVPITPMVTGVGTPCAKILGSAATKRLLLSAPYHAARAPV